MRRPFPFIWILLALCSTPGQDSHVGQISGSVADPTSASVAGAFVTLLSLNRVLQTKSTADGAFHFGGLEQGAFFIEVTAPGFTRKTIPVTLQSSHSEENILVVINVGNMPDMENAAAMFRSGTKALMPRGQT